MHLNPKQIQRLKNACIWVFGSRVDDKHRGGGYDFYIETSKTDPDEIVINKLNILVDLHASPEFEGEKIDLVIRSAVPGPDLPIYKVAKEQGVRL